MQAFAVPGEADRNDAYGTYPRKEPREVMHCLIEVNTVVEPGDKNDLRMHFDAILPESAQDRNDVGRP